MSMRHESDLNFHRTRSTNLDTSPRLVVRQHPSASSAKTNETTHSGEPIRSSNRLGETVVETTEKIDLRFYHST